MNREHFYNVGDISDTGLLIKEQIRIANCRGDMEKGYVVECVKDGYVYRTKETNIKKHGCPVCYNRMVVEGVNDIATTRRDLLVYFKDIDVAYNNVEFSNKRTIFICPECGDERVNRIADVAMYGFKCRRCCDGFKYPNKFMFNLLRNIGIEFETEYSPVWANKKRYDFYIPSKKLIIEMDGEFHYKGNRMNNQTIHDVAEIDNYKTQIARLNNITVVRVDCDYPSRNRFEHIKKNVIRELNKLLNLCDVDWAEIDKKSQESKLVKAVDMYKEGMSNKEISEKLGINSCTVNDYLKRARDVGMCNYVNVHEKRGCVQDGFNGKKRIVIVETGEEFESLTEMCNVSIDVLGIRISPAAVSVAIKGNRKCKGFTFKYV